MKCRWIKALLIAAVGCTLGPSAITAHAALTHRYSFASDATDSVGTAHGTLQGVATAAAGSLNFNNPGFPNSAPGRGYLSLPVSILPTSGSVTIEQWFQFGGSGFFTEAYTFRNGPADPGGTFGQYLLHTVSNPQGGPTPAGGGSSVGQSLAGYGGGAESRAFSTTPGLGAGGGGFLDDGVAYMAATVIDGTAGTLSYYLYRVSDGVGGLQHSITAIPLSSYSFVDAFLGRSAFDGDNYVSGTVDEFRIYNHAKNAAGIAADFGAGPNTLPVPEPASVGLAALAIAGSLAAARRRVQ